MVCFALRSRFNPPLSNISGVSPSRYSNLESVSVEAWAGVIDVVSVLDFLGLDRYSMPLRGTTTIDGFSFCQCFESESMHSEE